MDAAQWPQDIVVVSSATTATTTAMINAARPAAAAAQVMPMEGRRAIRAHKEQALNCPRCNSTNTKFCYYNNYSLTQPRYFCKTCRRYWTEGGSLRNVPVGGGSRKNKRSSSSTSIITNPNPNPNPNPTPKHDPTPLSSQNPKFHEGQDLNLAYPHHNLHEFADHFPNMEGNNNNNNSNNALSAMELIRSGRGLMSPFMAYPSGFSLQDHMRPPTLNFPLDGSNGGGGYGVSEGSGRLLFPFEDLKQVLQAAPLISSSKIEGNEGKHQGSGMYISTPNCTLGIKKPVCADSLVVWKYKHPTFCSKMLLCNYCGMGLDKGTIHF